MYNIAAVVLVALSVSTSTVVTRRCSSVWWSRTCVLFNLLADVGLRHRQHVDHPVAGDGRRRGRHDRPLRDRRSDAGELRRLRVDRRAEPERVHAPAERAGLRLAHLATYSNATGTHPLGRARPVHLPTGRVHPLRLELDGAVAAALSVPGTVDVGTWPARRRRGRRRRRASSDGFCAVVASRPWRARWRRTADDPVIPAPATMRTSARRSRAPAESCA